MGLYFCLFIFGVFCFCCWVPIKVFEFERSCLSSIVKTPQPLSLRILFLPYILYFFILKYLILGILVVRNAYFHCRALWHGQKKQKRRKRKKKKYLILYSLYLNISHSLCSAFWTVYSAPFFSSLIPILTLICYWPYPLNLFFYDYICYIRRFNLVLLQDSLNFSSSPDVLLLLCFCLPL